MEVNQFGAAFESEYFPVRFLFPAVYNKINGEKRTNE